MILPIFFILISLILLYFGASWLVKGSSSLAIKAGVSPLVTGLTVVAFGSSSPGLFVSVSSALAGLGNIAIGNALGSNVFNICIILGISALVSPLKIRMNILKTGIPILILSALGFMFLFADRLISRTEGFVLLAGIALYTFLNIYLARREKNNEALCEFHESVSSYNSKWYWSALIISAGIGFLIAGSEFLVKGAVAIASMMGVGDTIIGITIIAAGTSVPLLATSVISAIRKEFDLAVGIVVSSSIFNLLGIVGVSAIVKPLSAIAISNIDLYVMLGVTLFLLPFFKKQYVLKRDEGIFMIILYFIYLYYLWPK
ncbi:MAG: calcium/sodium antiporter [Bacteroidota bacterium]